MDRLLSNLGLSERECKIIGECVFFSRRSIASMNLQRSRKTALGFYKQEETNNLRQSKRNKKGQHDKRLSQPLVYTKQHLCV
jgi:hypothetical protein